VPLDIDENVPETAHAIASTTNAVSMLILIFLAEAIKVASKNKRKDAVRLIVGKD